MSCLKVSGSTRGLGMKLLDLSPDEGSGTAGVAVKCVDIGRNTSGKGGSLFRH